MASTERQLQTRRENAKKSTGPRTEEGKARSSMNGLKHGLYVKRFYKISGKQAGNLVICRACGEDQMRACRVDESCLLHDELTLRYVHAHQTGNVKHIEEINVLQAATMDMIFSQKLRYAQIHLGEKEKIYDKKSGKYVYKEIVDNEYIYMLMNLMGNLNKKMTDMQLTRQTQENIDVAWAELAKTEISAEKAAETKQAIVGEMAKWREAQGTAGDLENMDDAIREFRKNERQANDKSGGRVDPAVVGNSPFGDGK